MTDEEREELADRVREDFWVMGDLWIRRIKDNHSLTADYED